MDILDEIVVNKREEIAERRSYVGEQALVSLTDFDAPVASLRQSLTDAGIGIIAEFKRKSPSKGWIHRQANPSEVALDYQTHGAAALSILTDSKFFGGYDEFVQQARAVGVTIPILYKNFVIDPYQLLQARYCGASAVLLIAACLSKEECRDLIRKAHSINLEVLLEMHSEEELDYAELEPDVLGINNRNLGTFITDVNNSFRLIDKLPKDACKVSESGIHDAKTILDLHKSGFNGFLLGEYLMKEEQPGMALERLNQALGVKR